ncbi:MAG: tetratricopeptide repeat protein [Myxococcota bacterium]
MSDGDDADPGDEKARRRLVMLDKMIEKGADDPFVWYARALELRALGRLEDALSAFSDVEARYPDYVPTYLMAGQVAEALGRTEEARSWLERGRERATAAGDVHARSEIEQALAALQ